MKKIINLKIDGMKCMHCVKHVSDALLALDGVNKVKVNLDEGSAKVVITKDIDVDTFKDAISEAGFNLIEVL